MRLYVPEEEDSESLAERWSDVLTVVRRRRPADPGKTRRAIERRRPPGQDGPLLRLGGPLLAVVIALWLTAGVWGARPPAGEGTLGHLVLAEFSIDHILGKWQLDGWQPRFSLGHEAFLFLGPGFFWAVGLMKLLSVGLLSAAGAFKVVVVASFVLLPLAVVFLARSSGFDPLEAGVAGILTLAVSSPFGGVGLEGLFGWGLVIQQFGAVFFFLAFGSLLRLVADPRPPWTIFTAAMLAALLVSHVHSAAVLGVVLLVLFVAMRIPRVASALGRMQQSQVRGDGSRGTDHVSGVPLFSNQVRRHLLVATALAFGLASFHLLPLLAHVDLQGPPTGFGTPPIGEQIISIVRGELLFRPVVAVVVILGWGFALTGARRYRPYLPAFAITPLAYLALAHWAAWQWPGNVLALQLPERGLGYAGVLAILPLAVLIARLGRRSRGWRGAAGALGLAAILVVMPLGRAKDVARQTRDPIPQMHEAARQLRSLVPGHARFATDRDGSGGTNLTGVPNPHHWLAWASGRNTLNNFGIELSAASEPPLEPERIAVKPPDDVAETLSRLGVTHVVALSDQSAARLARSRRLAEVWRSSPLAILSVSAGSGQPDPADLVTFDSPGHARLAGAQPNHIAIQIEPSRRAWATLPLSWSPKWHALLDGEPVDLWKAANGSMALEVPPGSARLMLEFRPDRWDRLGGATTLATLVLLARRRRQNRARRMAQPRVPSVDSPAHEEEAHREVPARQPLPEVVPATAERVAPALLGVEVTQDRPAGAFGDVEVSSRAERVAQALLGALDGSPRKERVSAREDLGAPPRARSDDRHPTRGSNPGTPGGS